MADCGGMPQVDQVCMSVFVQQKQEKSFNVVEQAGQGWIIGAEGQVDRVDGIRRLHLRALASSRHEPQLSGCNPPPCAAPAHSSCHISDPEQ